MGWENADQTVDGGRSARDAQSHRNPPRVFAFLAVAAWLLVLLVGLGYAAMVQLVGDGYCEPFEGSSQYGELRWSALPPGPTCTFTADVHGFDEVRGPYPVMSIWLAVLVVGAAACLVLLRASRGGMTGPAGHARVAE